MAEENKPQDKLELGPRIGVPDGPKAIRLNLSLEDPLTPEEKARFEALIGPAEKLPDPGKPAAPTVLIADDDPQMRGYFRTIVATMNCEAVDTPDGAEALKALASKPFSMVLLDLKLPGLDGYLFLRAARVYLKRALPICVISGLRDPRDEAAALRLGADDFILKPSDYDRLTARFARLLRR